ncbi:peptidoglycan DD-metalloendopeptidase family protein [Candidatus Berkelbacteria bacterium]|nr:peptidoglycan DD-metalloendopeptidase family protein [Candidatus Berkelbacteria bacterium]
MLKKFLKWFAIFAGVVILFLALFLFQPWAFLPHKHIEISLPFPESADATTSLIPMGETIEHNAANGNPNGHPGIDFGFMGVTPIIASADGWVFSAGKTDAGSIDISTYSGFYKIEYKELNTIEPNIRRFTKIKKGQLLGYTGRDKIIQGRPTKEDGSGQIHWELASSSLLIDRLCPVGYFDAESRRRIEQIWANVPSDSQFKKDFPDICSGVFKDKED